MKQLFFILIIFCAFSVKAQVKAPKGFDVGGTIIDANEVKSLNGITGNIKDTLDSKISTSTLGSSLDEFYNKTQSNARFINEDGDTITGTILVPTPAPGTNTTQVVNADFVKTAINQGTGRRIFSSNVQVANTGNTTENTVLTFTIPAGTLSANGSLHFITLYSFTSSTNLKEFKVKIGSSTIGYWSTSSAGLSTREYYTLNNRNSLTSQISSPSTTASGGVFNQSPQSQAVSTYSIDFSVDQTCTVTIKNGLGTETLSVEAFECIAYY